jgi:hypothetical protein
VDNAFWQEVEVTDEEGSTEKEWHFITDPEAVANKALEQVQALFPRPLGWRPELPDAVFPADYAFAGHKVTSPELDEILSNIDKVDLTDVLVPMILEDLDALLRQHTKDSAPGISGVTYGHLRAMSPEHRQVCLQMVNRFIQYQHCPAKWLDVGIALIPKSDGAQGLGSGRPISLIEALMKLAEEWTSPRFKTAMLRHPNTGDLKLPAQPRGRMSRMQSFNSGGGAQLSACAGAPNLDNASYDSSTPEVCSRKHRRKRGVPECPH